MITRSSLVLLAAILASDCQTEMMADETERSAKQEKQAARLVELLSQYPAERLDPIKGEHAPKATQILETMQSVGDESLRNLADTAQGEKLELFLTEMIRRGGKNWRDYLAERLQREARAHADQVKKEGNLPGAGYLRNLELLTALRRISSEPDPLGILVAGPRNRSCELTRLPRLLALLVNLDAHRAEIHFTEGGDYRSGRQARWRLEVKDSRGHVLPQRTTSGIGGGISQHSVLKHGESWATELDMTKFVEIPGPGIYEVRVLYHDAETIANRDDVTGLIMCQTLPIRLEVSPIVVSLNDQESEAVRKAIAELPKEGPVKFIEGTYRKSLYDFIDLTSPAGQLLDKGLDAVPQLIDGSLDDDLNPTQRAWALAILASVTGYNDPRDERGVLGDYASRASGWKVWGGAPDAESGGLGFEESRQSSGTIDIERQKAFAKRWAIWKEKEYIKVVKNEM